MANHTATKKNIRKTEARTAVNKDRRSRVRTFLKKVEQAITGGEQKAAQEALRLAQSEMMSAVGKGIFKMNTASRRISRLSARIKGLKA
jgi:small subunit ribosomal protein S20